MSRVFFDDDHKKCSQNSEPSNCDDQEQQDIQDRCFELNRREQWPLQITPRLNAVGKFCRRKVLS